MNDLDRDPAVHAAGHIVAALHLRWSGVTIELGDALHSCTIRGTMPVPAVPLYTERRGAFYRRRDEDIYAIQRRQSLKQVAVIGAAGRAAEWHANHGDPRVNAYVLDGDAGLVDRYAQVGRGDSTQRYVEICQAAFALVSKPAVWRSVEAVAARFRAGAIDDPTEVEAIVQRTKRASRTNQRDPSANAALDEVRRILKRGGGEP